MVVLSFQIEFQPSGIRLLCPEPLTLLDAARQAGIPLRADCGGKGMCGKCRVQVLEDHETYHYSEAEIKHLNTEEREQGFHLACELVADREIKIYVASEALSEEQIIQIEGVQRIVEQDAAVRQQVITLSAANLHDLQSDYSRAKQTAGLPNLQIQLQTLRKLPSLIRSNDWQFNLVTRDDAVIHISEKPFAQLLGLAVDVGSTKIACYLMDLENGALLAAEGTPNSQIAYGEDIMARLAFAMQGPEDAQKLHVLVADAVNQTSLELCRQIDRTPDEIADLCLVGNTAMHHFFLNLPTGTLAVSPFTPVISDALYADANQIGLNAMPGAGVYAPAVIAGFVGSDHLAFLYSCGFGQQDATRLGIDIGTNTEIALQKGDRIVSVSTASGPAFEGAHIKFGMRAAPGAIEHVRIDQNGSTQVDVIGGQTPVGICGSGILDAVAELRTAGILNKRGRLKKGLPYIRLDAERVPYFTLAVGEKEITLSQHDVDQILLAKGAIRAGIDVLMDALNVTTEEIEEVVIAGAFGSYMLPEQAVRLGLLPDIPLERVRAVGNAAGSGARMMLASQQARVQSEALAQRIEYLELTVYPDFPMFYARGISA